MADDPNPCLVQAHTAESCALNVPNAILSDAWLDMLGGGRLDRMFMHATRTMDYKVCVLNPNPSSPAGTIAERHLCADYTDETALVEMTALCPAVTTEFENVPAWALDRLGQLGASVTPRANCVSITQNHIAKEKLFTLCAACAGIHPASSWVIEYEADIEQLPTDLLPGILKIARMGYDGGGRTRVSTVEELRAA